MSIVELKSPYPFFGGKSTIAGEVWSRFGVVDNFVEPFAGSAAMLLGAPWPSTRTETINDKCGFIANFWRAIRHDPEAVAAHCDWPVNEHDLEARHWWLISKGAQRLAELLADPEAFDAKVAGWWVYGVCAWIGSGWCSGEGPWIVGDNGWELRNAGQGVNRQLPHLGDAGKAILAYLAELSERLRKVRVCCGDWARVVTPSITFRHGMTAVFLDPPYGEGGLDYSVGGNRTDIAQDVRRWAIANGDNAGLRIAFCGYDGSHEFPATWSEWSWKSAGGYSATNGDSDSESNRNRGRERVWFSQHCIGQRELF
jgi:DNA adenine methylase